MLLSYQDIRVVLTQRVSPYVPRVKKSLASSWATPFRLAASKSSWGISLSLQLKGAEKPHGVVRSRHSVFQPKTRRDIYDCIFFSGKWWTNSKGICSNSTKKKWRDCSEMWMDRAGMQPSSRLIQSTGWNLRRVTNAEMQSEIVTNIELISRMQVNVMFLSSLLMTLSQWYITKPDPSLY